MLALNESKTAKHRYKHGPILTARKYSNFGRATLLQAFDLYQDSIDGAPSAESFEDFLKENFRIGDGEIPYVPEDFDYMGYQFEAYSDEEDHEF